MKNKIITLALAGLVILALALLGGCNPVAQPMGVTNLDSLHLAGSEGTATPILMVQSNGDSLPFQVNNSSGTPVFYSDASGNLTYSGGVSSGGNLVVTGPTAAATATPALVVNNLGAANEILSLRDAATPVFVVYNSGTWADTGAASHSALHTFTSGFVANSSAQVNAATAVATATPAFYVNNTGAGNSIFELRKAATPVFSVYNDATWADSGAATHSGLHTFSAGLVSNGASQVNAATAVATQTPALIVNSLGAGNVLLDVRKASTPVFSINNDGSWADTGAGTHSAGQTVNNWVIVTAPTAIATATPAMVVDSSGVSSLFEARYLATPVFSIYSGGTWADAGAATHSALHTFDAGFISNSSSQVNAPTAEATQTPALIVDSLAAGAELLSVRKAATPVFTINNDGTWADAGAATHSGLHTFSVGFVSNASGVINVPTAVATETPGLIVDNTGAGNVSIEVRKDATPVFAVNNSGAVDLNANTLSNVGNAGTDFDASGGLTLADKAVVGTWLRFSAQAFTVEDGLPITPTKTYVLATSGGVVATDTTVPIEIGGHTAGEILIIENGNAADAITIDGVGGTVECKADVVLGALDTVTLLFDGTQWVCLSLYDNS